MIACAPAPAGRIVQAGFHQAKRASDMFHRFLVPFAAATLVALPSCRHKPMVAPTAYYPGRLAEPVGPVVHSRTNRAYAKALTPIARDPAARTSQPASRVPKGWNPASPQAPAPAGGYPNVSYSHGSRNNRYIALTFDDGPHAANTPRLLDLLAERNVKATFFVLAPRVRARPDLVQRMVADGHEIGNHSSTHRLMTKLADVAVLADFKQTHDAVVAACGSGPTVQRPPYGSMNARQRSMLKDQLGYSCILWDIDPLDWRRPGPGVVAARVVSGATNGSIILLHDIHAGSVQAVPQIVDTLIAQGYTFVTVSQLLALSGQ